MQHDNLFFEVRGKSDRRRKRLSIQQRQKHLLGLDRQLDQLYKTRNELGYEELEEPYQKGYVRSFVLREDTRVSKLEPFYSSILKQINTYQYSETKLFRKRRRKYGKRYYVNKEQYLVDLNEYQYQKLPPFLQVYFVRIESYHPQWKRMEMKYRFAEPWRFELEIRPYFITHRKKIDQELESAINQLRNFFERHHLYDKIYHIKGKSYYNRSCSPKGKYVLPSIFKLKQQINDY